ncbi:uncharacterized protein FIBRA_04874 [Fibroporia radiculosa]|uniref:Uncharacterized protein n=1 Tax=Fibroporia radiculosa TaxID=599839 RepID=J4IAE4_9APHY|nr:uncharacterized protein FIBRA_04874 [Fibroporia radiculosa]CCM02766.1 predicted protein [Fibroporia radiculosa]
MSPARPLGRRWQAASSCGSTRKTRAPPPLPPIPLSLSPPPPPAYSSQLGLSGASLPTPAPHGPPSAGTEMCCPQPPAIAVDLRLHLPLALRSPCRGTSTIPIPEQSFLDRPLSGPPLQPPHLLFCHASRRLPYPGGSRLLPTDLPNRTVSRDDPPAYYVTRSTVMIWSAPLVQGAPRRRDSVKWHSEPSLEYRTDSEEWKMIVIPTPSPSRPPHPIPSSPLRTFNTRSSPPEPAQPLSTFTFERPSLIDNIVGIR